jgi:MFS family permease
MLEQNMKRSKTSKLFSPADRADNPIRSETTGAGIFYGWVIVVACFATTFTLGEAFWTFGVFFKPLQHTFSWTRAAVSSAYTAFLIAHSISTIVTGRLADTYSPRPILLSSALLVGVGVFLCSRVHTVIQLQFFLFLAGLGAGATWSIPMSIVQRWFYQRPKAGLALGIVAAGIGVGGLTFVPVINYVILTHGWRTAYMAIGISFFLTIAVSSLFIKPAPSCENQGKPPKSGSPGHPPVTVWTAHKAMATMPFITITILNCIVILTFQAVSVHLIPHATDLGISPAASAAALGLIGGFSVPGRILSGYISDRISWKKLLSFSLFGMALSLLWLLFVTKPWMLYVFVLFFGFSQGSRISAHLGILGEFFGMHSLGQLVAVPTAVGMFIGAFSPYITGFLFDTTGSYFSAFMTMIVILTAAGAVAALMQEPTQL